MAIASEAVIELQMMAEVYAQALEAAGFVVERRPSTPDAALLHTGLTSGSLHVVPGHLATHLAQIGIEPSGDATDDLARLRQRLAADGLDVLRPSSAEWTTGFGMRQEDASARGFGAMSDLVAVAAELTWGIPPDCASLPACGHALTESYGIALEALPTVSVTACDPATAEALNDAAVDVALLCTTQPEVERFNLVILEDDRHGQPPGAIVPIVHHQLLAAAGEPLTDALETISAEMTTAELASLAARVTVDGEAIGDVARSWLEDHGLV